MLNANLNVAQKVKNDEFYTRREDIEAELKHYVKHFQNKIIYCNCDNPATSEFWKFFIDVFNSWGLKKLIATYYELDNQKSNYSIELCNLNDKPIVKQLESNGDFRSRPCIELLQEADIVVTNPPFSLFREYIEQLMEYNKKFLIIGPQHALTYRDVFSFFQNNQLWLGCTSPRYFIKPDSTMQYFGNIKWFTNLDIDKRHKPLDLQANHYYGNEDKYPFYENCNAININKVVEIPGDYSGEMGVPISFVEKYCPEQFEIIGMDYEYAKPIILENGRRRADRLYIKKEDNKLHRLFGRILIKKKI